jgi:hypothetical protein
LNATLPLVLLFQAPPSAPLGSRDQRTIERFSARWSVQFEPSRARSDAEAPESLPKYPPSAPVVAHVEELLDAARLALARLDEAEAREALRGAERLLLQHPQLPQAAWLRAEQLTILAELGESADGGAPDALDLRRRARALEGPRAQPFQDRDRPPNAGTQITTESDTTLSVGVTGFDARDALEWDGVRVTPPFETAPGQHQVRVLRRGWLVWAAWISVDARAASASLAAPAIAPCSSDDLAGTTLGANAPKPAAGTLCPRWAAARRHQGELELALCRHSECGRFHRLPAESRAAPARPAQREPQPFPTWATVAIASAGAALATSVVLWQTGAFDSPPERERWVYRGFELFAR